jgi:ABC-2 type transport system ATP-binding protein
LKRLDTKEMTVTLDRDIAAIPDALKRFNVDIRNGRELRFSYPPSKINSGEILAAIGEAGLGVVDLATRQAELEDIFLKLTGRDPRSA